MNNKEFYDFLIKQTLMNNIKLYFTHFRQPLPSVQFSSYLQMLPTNLQKKVQKFVRWQDQHASLFARLLLQRGLRSYDIQLDEIKYTQYQRPYIDKDIDFNLAHSGEYVVCAITETGRIGIDIEQVRSLELQHFKSTLTTSQWQVVTANPSLFFEFWTQKESVIKADGRGMYLPLDQIEPVHNQVILQADTWFLHEIKDFLPHYVCHLATDQLNIKIKQELVSFYDSK